MKKWLLLLCLAFGLCAPALAAKLPADPEPDKQSLLLAWERVQSQDPHTKKFEKVGDKRYFLETDLFPFKNEVQVLHLTVDDEYPDEIEGFIAVQLDGVDEAFKDSYYDNYRVWDRHNSLIWSSDVNKWLTHKEFEDLEKSLTQKTKQTKSSSAKAALTERIKSVLRIATSLFFWVLLLAACVAFFVGYKKQAALRRELLVEQRNMNALTARFVKTQQVSNQLLQAIYNRLGPVRQTAKPKTPSKQTPAPPSK